MKIKAKKFSRKLLALVMAIVMGVTCFSGVFSAYAASDSVKYNDEAVEYNSLAWKVLSDEQTATALLDYADAMLKEYGPELDKMLSGVLPSGGMFYYDYRARMLRIDAYGIIKANIKLYAHSIDEVMETIESVESTIRGFETFLGDAGNIHLTATAGMRRNNTSSCDMIRGVLGLFQQLSADYSGADILGCLLRGEFDLGTVGSLANINIYTAIGPLLGLDAGYEQNFVYNLAQSLLFNYTTWFTAEEIAAYKANPATFVYDDVLLQKLSQEVLSNIPVWINYMGAGEDVTVSSPDRYQAIKDKVAAEGITFKEAAASLGYDPEIVYNEEGYVYLFKYGTKDDGSVADDAQILSLVKEDTLFSFAYRACDLAWKTALKDTVSLIHVNYDSYDYTHGTNFDNDYFYWARTHIDGGWNQNDLPAMYSQANINAWAEAVYTEYEAKDAAEFLEWVKEDYNFSTPRTCAEGSTGKWSDIDETNLFNKLRYSPLADYGFNMETGPLNLYFMQTGVKNLYAFFDTYHNYNSIVGGFNDALVAAVKDIFVVRDNVYGDAAFPELGTINPSIIDENAIVDIVLTLVGNAVELIQYTADSTDSNILKAFYDANGESAKLTEENLEAAMVPLLIACVGQINLNGYKMQDYIHPEDWDACKDVEAVAFVALREYLSFVLPMKDYNTLVTKAADGSIEATLEGTILPMARDAVVYVLQGYVPVTDVNGDAWNVYERPVNDDTDLFEILNSVVCYYGGEYNFTNPNVTKSVGAMGFGALLGICDSQGKSLITLQNTLWENIDLVANKLLPVLGTLQYGDPSKYGHLNSEELIMSDIVNGALEIGDTSIHESGMGGVSNFLYRLITIISAEPIQSNPITLTVYDFLADLFNGIFKPRYSGQSFDPVIPARTSDHPFDDLFQKEKLVGTSGTDLGALQKMICNATEFCGYSAGNINAYPDSILRGIMFGLQAVNTFVPNAITPIGGHSLKMASAEYTDRVVTGKTSGDTVASTVEFTNNSIGINNALVDGIKNENVQLSRYYMRITNATVKSSTNSECDVTGFTNALIAPGETVKLSASSTYVPDDKQSTSFSATIIYDVCEADGTVLYSGLEANAYQYVSGAKGWKDVVYPGAAAGRPVNHLALELESDSGSQTMNFEGYTAYTSSNFAENDYLHLGYPKDIVMTTSNLSDIENIDFRVKNVSIPLFGGDRNIDGFYCYDVKNDLVNDMTGGTSSVNMSNAIPIYDKETGDLLKNGKFDYSLDGGVTWNRNGVNGYTQDDINGVINSNPGANITTRTHVVYTLEEAKNLGIIACYHRNEAGIFEYLYLQSRSSSGADSYYTILSQISMRGPVDGIYIGQGFFTCKKNEWAYTSDLFIYDDVTPIPAGQYPVKLCAYNSKKSGTTDNAGRECTLTIGDDSAAASLDTTYNNLTKLLTNYRAEDFTNPEVRSDAEAALLEALGTQASVITPETAIALSDKAVLTSNKSTTTSIWGDKAYKPFSEANAAELGMPVAVKADAYVKDGYYYLDENCTIPIYSNVPLEASDVVDGKDPVGVEVIEGDTVTYEGEFWYKNQPVYETEWNTTSYTAPWRQDKVVNGEKVQATNDAGEPLYYVEWHSYRDAKGAYVNVERSWQAMHADASYQCIPNDGVTEDNRGLYSQAADRLAYIEELVYESLDSTIANDLFTQISLVRNSDNMWANNFEVSTYDKMIDTARVAEGQYTLNIPYSYEKKTIDETTGEVTTEIVNEVAEDVSFNDYNSYINNEAYTVDVDAITVNSNLSSVQVEEQVRLFNVYMSMVVERGYNGQQIEKEIECATGNAYDKFTVTKATYDEDGKVVTNAVVNSNGAGEPAFGVWSEDGTLVNEGDVIYSDELWNNYVNYLAEAVSIAQLGNGDYTHKNEDYYKPAEVDTYNAEVEDCYYADTDLQAAEVALESAYTVTVADVEGGSVTINGTAVDPTKPYMVGNYAELKVAGVPDEGYAFEGFEEEYVQTVTDPETQETSYIVYINSKDITLTPVFTATAAPTHAVTTSIVVAKDANGATDGVAVNGDYTVTVYNAADDTEVLSQTFTLSAADNSITLNLAPGTYYAVIESAYSVTRDDIDIIVGDADITAPAIPVIACEYNADAKITGIDAITVYSNASGAQASYCDLNGDGKVTGIDAVVVYACAAGGTMTPIVIQ